VNKCLQSPESLPTGAFFVYPEQIMSIRAKMRLSSVVAQQWGGAQAIFSCEYDNTIPEDKKFQQATPTGMAQFTIDNPAAIEQLVIGKTYYFDISPSDAPAAADADTEG